MAILNFVLSYWWLWFNLFKLSSFIVVSCKAGGGICQYDSSGFDYFAVANYFY